MVGGALVTLVCVGITIAAAVAVMGGIVRGIEKASQRHLAEIQRRERRERDAARRFERRHAPKTAPAEPAARPEIAGGPAAVAAQPPPRRKEVRGRVRVLAGGAEVALESLPPTPHGEMLKGAWAGGGHLFVVGYQYGDAPGEEAGSIWHRFPDGRWALEWRADERRVVALAGERADDLWAVGSRSLVHFDGTAWHEEALPPLGDGKGLSAAWPNPRGELFAATFDGRLFRRASGGAWAQELDQGGGQILALAGRGEEVVCCGDSGQIRRRLPDGSWKAEDSGVKSQLRLALSCPEGLYLAGGLHLLFSAAPGSWQTVEGAPSWLRSLCRGADGELVACNGDTFARRAGAWQLLSKGVGEAAAADGGTLYVVELAEPPTA